jgi:hypothetical protein
MFLSYPLMCFFPRRSFISLFKPSVLLKDQDSLSDDFIYNDPVLQNRKDRSHVILDAIADIGAKIADLALETDRIIEDEIEDVRLGLLVDDNGMIGRIGHTAKFPVPGKIFGKFAGVNGVLDAGIPFPSGTYQ